MALKPLRGLTLDAQLPDFGTLEAHLAPNLLKFSALAPLADITSPSGGSLGSLARARAHLAEITWPRSLG